MTTPSDNGKQEKRLLEALDETWASMDETFNAEPAPLPDWTVLVRERRRLAKRKLWKELAILWVIGIPILGIMLLLITGMQTVFWILQAAATVSGIPLLIGECKRVSRAGEKGGIAP